MRTDELIAALAADIGRPRWRSRQALALAMLAGALGALAMFVVLLGPRPDLGAALTTWRFDWKLVLIAVAAVLAFADCARLADPSSRGLAGRASLAIPALLLAGVAVELAVTPAASWLPRLYGSNAAVCLASIPLLAVVPLVAGLAAMRHGAPASGAEAGAAAGRLAAAVAALLYAVHCADDSPLFVAVWYVLATIPVMLAGAVAGGRVLRW